MVYFRVLSSQVNLWPLRFLTKRPDITSQRHPHWPCLPETKWHFEARSRCIQGLRPTTRPDMFKGCFPAGSECVDAGFLPNVISSFRLKTFFWFLFVGFKQPPQSLDTVIWRTVHLFWYVWIDSLRITVTLLSNHKTVIYILFLFISKKPQVSLDNTHIHVLLFNACFFFLLPLADGICQVHLNSNFISQKTRFKQILLTEKCIRDLRVFVSEYTFQTTSFQPKFFAVFGRFVSKVEPSGKCAFFQTRWCQGFVMGRSHQTRVRRRWWPICRLIQC